jgi:phosphatidylserine decarboxylase
MAREGYPYLIFLGVFAIVAGLLGLYISAALFLLLLLVIGYSYRDPERSVPAESGIIVSPADGRISKIEEVETASTGLAKLIQIDRSLLDVQINRAPINGRISEISHYGDNSIDLKQRKLILSNRLNVITFENGSVKIIMKQIAGIFARRSAFWKQQGAAVALGERVGLGELSLRTDLVMPAEFQLLVKPGDRVLGGVTIIGRKSL